MVFDKMLAPIESNIFKNDIALDYSFHSKFFLHQEHNQLRVAEAILSLLSDNMGRTIYAKIDLLNEENIGAPIKNVLDDLKEARKDDIFQFYINCWQNNTEEKMLIKICMDMGLKIKKDSNLRKLIKDNLNKPAVFVFENLNYAEEVDLYHWIKNEIELKTIIIISRLELMGVHDYDEVIHFQYTSMKQIKDVIRQRVDLALKKDVLAPGIIKRLAGIAFYSGDIMRSMRILKEACLLAEDEEREYVTMEDIDRVESGMFGDSICAYDRFLKDPKTVHG